ncbi:MAG: polysaccharide pyruvyl transferase family protein, partial [Methanobacterium sp.]|nr:polysaccharide pyruvyl transferase family protein [Methanobacterium sp.]
FPTLNEKNLRRYLKEEPGIHIEPISPVFIWDVIRLVKKHDLVLLVEGSCYMDTWTSALLWAFLWATNRAHRASVPCIAYAVDSGKLSYFSRYLVRREASKTDLIITRTKRAAKELKKIGVTCPMEVTADCAFNYTPNKEDYNILSQTWPSSDSIVGLAVVDFNLWPVVIRPWGKKEYEYRWPYYFSRSKERRDKSEELAINWAREADRIIEKHGRKIALICMEEVDEPLAQDILSKMENSNKAKIFSSSTFNASQMTHILQRLDLLVTSRYHAGVLSLEAGVPQIALGHDTRLKGFYEELGIGQDYLIDCYQPNIWDRLQEKIDVLIKNPLKVRKTLKKGFQEHLSRSLKNRELLKGFLNEKGWVLK